MTESIFEELQWRGLMADYTRVPGTGETPQPQLPERLAAGPITLYCGFDPTADSLHVGSLVPLIALRRFQQAGHHAIAIAGGATGSIGDPSGKTQERSLLTKAQIEANVEAIRPQLARLLDFEVEQNPARLLDNASWIAPLSFIDFLRDVGKYFTVNQMVGKESVRARMEDRDVGISYTEFSYMLLQAYDFYHLADQHGCELQIGGTDQWGNITAGMDLIRKRLGRHVYGLTMPLITKADGTKFGKTESGTIWLDTNRTSVYQFYQFWIQTDDRDVVRYLKYFTFLTREQISALEAAHAANPGGREAHAALAREMTRLLHGDTALRDAETATKILFGGGLDNLQESTVTELLRNVIFAEAPEAEVAAGYPVVDALVKLGLSPSKGQARKDIEGGGVYLNSERVTDPTAKVTPEHLLLGKAALLRKGKRNYALLCSETQVTAEMREWPTYATNYLAK
jgi:tyrosyl-tRNA synthetase